MEGKWDLRFLRLAQHVAQWSKDPSTQVGCVVVRPDRTIASVGYNGFPRGVKDLPERYADANTKYKLVVHAEANALIHAKEDLHEYSMYTWPMLPCSGCAGMVIQAGIRHVVAPRCSDQLATRWNLSETVDMFTEAGVYTTLYSDEDWADNDQ